MRDIRKNIIDEFQTCSFEKLWERTAGYKWISFDIFDTLIKRDVHDPKDVFAIVEKRCKYEGFAEIRVNAEKRARLIDPNHEPNLHEIYKYIDEKNLSEREKLKKAELSVERDICSVNKDIKCFYDYCVAYKKVILITDMYLPLEEIEEILSRNHISGYEKIYISSEYKKNKLKGELFTIALKENEIKKEEIIHIGNSFRADLVTPLMTGIDALKICANRHSLGKKYVDIFRIGDKYNTLLKFLENHTLDNDPYYQFGFERMGPLLSGFSIWLVKQLKINGNKNAVFLSRDGYLIKRVYDILEFDKIIPSYYFNLSRRSLRVPLIYRNEDFKEIISELPLSSRINMRQVIDTLGLEPDCYKRVILESGFDMESLIKRDALIKDERFRGLFERIREDVFYNAENERAAMVRYFEQTDYWDNAGIIDIGWGGSIQNYLLQILESLGLSSRLNGYYLGLTYKAHEKAANRMFRAKGYLFDRFNYPDKFKDMERPFVGLFETLFPEQKGSVKKYEVDGKLVKIVRYPYEFEQDGVLTREAIAIQKAQKGAMDFVMQFKKSPIFKVIGDDRKVAFSNLYQTGVNPQLEDVRLFGDFAFFNNGTKVALASPESALEYTIHPGRLKDDLFDAQWKVGFLKRLFKVPFPYDKVYGMMNYIANYRTVK